MNQRQETVPLPYCQTFRTMHSSHMLREGARPEVVREKLGHANIHVTQDAYGNSWWEERVDAVTQAVVAGSLLMCTFR